MVPAAGSTLPFDRRKNEVNPPTLKRLEPDLGVEAPLAPLAPPEPAPAPRCGAEAECRMSLDGVEVPLRRMPNRLANMVPVLRRLPPPPPPPTSDPSRLAVLSWLMVRLRARLGACDANASVGTLRELPHTADWRAGVPAPDGAAEVPGVAVAASTFGPARSGLARILCVCV